MVFNRTRSLTERSMEDYTICLPCSQTGDIVLSGTNKKLVGAIEVCDHDRMVVFPPKSGKLRVVTHRKPSRVISCSYIL